MDGTVGPPGSMPLICTLTDVLADTALKRIQTIDVNASGGITAAQLRMKRTTQYWLHFFRESEKETKQSIKLLLHSNEWSHGHTGNKSSKFVSFSKRTKNKTSSEWSIAEMDRSKTTICDTNQLMSNIPEFIAAMDGQMLTIPFQNIKTWKWISSPIDREEEQQQQP